MKRSDFLKTLGAVGAVGAVGVAAPAAVLAVGRDAGRDAARTASRTQGGCALLPSEIAGPFPLDLSANTFFLRQDIREDRVGAPLRLRMRVVDMESCEPLQDVRINIWLCDSAGEYSGYGTEVDLTYQRGYQITDADGYVEFLTIFPGFYPGRVVHVHFQVFVSSQYAAVSQFTWDHDEAVALHSAHPDLYPQGPDPMTPEQDMSFSDGYALQTATLTWAPEEGGEGIEGEYLSNLEVAVDGSTLVGVGYLERETAARMELGQNVPNPFETMTRVPFDLHVAGAVSLELWSAAGRLLQTFDLGQLQSGAHSFTLDFEQLGLAAGSHIVQLKLETGGRSYCSFRRLTKR
jgi:protocatechuate 3,4-dioxygenase beta subunit